MRNDFERPLLGPWRKCATACTMASSQLTTESTPGEWHIVFFFHHLGPIGIQDMLDEMYDIAT
jgi:hypothetical protein